MKAVILAAGYGTRLLKDLKNANEQQLQDLIGTPKPLLPIGGSPLISYWIEALQAELDPKDIFIVTNIIYYSKFKEWSKNYPSVTVISDGTSTNEERLGAVSCLQLIIEKFEMNDNIIVIGGDTLFYEDFHLHDVMKKYQVLYKNNNEANLVLSYICKDEETTKYGILEADENYRITAIKEKPLASDTASRQAPMAMFTQCREKQKLLTDNDVSSKHDGTMERGTPPPGTGNLEYKKFRPSSHPQ
ncbi:glucose-1-phosphate thymidylyltransferase-like isoform X2 [Dendropsophus ebraccatus]|uniref:glucose-1-phosphate thymidylyltransferase-like isoform X2 n=1 Tax=Dendropsophus ebraccatus TaxID=150705 RepID=UPI0038310ABD